MEWIKQGQVYKFKGHHPQLVSHAANPLPKHLQGDVYRVFFSVRNGEQKSSVTYVDIDIVKQAVIYDHQQPVFLFGEEGSFYSHGVSIGNIYRQNGQEYMGFMGWNWPPNNHWRGDIGRLRVVDNEKLIADPAEAFMPSDADDPISLSYPFVIFDEGIYKMWYGTVISWTSENGEMISPLKYATSVDGESWQKHGVAIPYTIGIAQTFSRPTVIIKNGQYHMWYSYRSGDGTPYRIGYSRSNDGTTWENKLEETGIDVSATGWDSEMICYPYVFEHKEQLYMLYNGNSYGKTGFGMAIAKQ